MPVPDILTTPYYFSITWNDLSDLRRIAETVSLPEKLESATPKRKAEFLAGRFCAAKAIQALSPHWTGQVGMDPDGAPQWPGNLVGSITHTQGFTAAAVAPKDVCLSIGIDSEAMEDAGLLKTSKALVITDTEQHLNSRLPLSEDQFMLLLFSAKESIYKCLYPLIKRSLEFSAIILDAIDVQNRTFDFHLTESIPPDVLNDGKAQGRFEFSQRCVHTAVELKKNSI